MKAILAALVSAVADCAGGANGFIDISDWGATDYRPVGPELLRPDGSRVDLFFGTFGGRGYAS